MHFLLSSTLVYRRCRYVASEVSRLTMWLCVATCLLAPLGVAVDVVSISTSLSPGQPFAYETGQKPGIFVVSRGSSTLGALVVSFSVVGTATRNTAGPVGTFAASDDYQLLDSAGALIAGNTLTIPDGSSSITISVLPFDDANKEGSETVQINLISGAGYNVSTQSSDTVTIADNDVSATLNVIESNASESFGKRGVLRVAFSDTTLSKNVEVAVAGTATISSDYQMVVMITTDTVTSLGGSSDLNRRTVGYTVNSGASTGAGTVNINGGSAGFFQVGDYIQFSSDSLYYQVGSVGTGSLDISPSLQRDLTDKEVVTNAPVVTLNGAGRFSISAFPTGYDHLEIGVLPLGDNTPEGAETVILSLVDTSDFQLNNPSTGTVVIADDDSLASILGTTDGNESGVDGVFQVTLTQPLPQAVDVIYDVSGSAVPGTDYQTLPGVLRIPANATSANIIVSPTGVNLGVASKFITVTLHNSPNFLLVASSGSGPGTTSSINIFNGGGGGGGGTTTGSGKPTPGSINTGSKGCGSGSGIATLVGLALWALRFTLLPRRRRGY